MNIEQINNSESGLADASTQSIHIESGGFWLRTVATLIDSFWLYGIIYVIIFTTIGYNKGHTISQFILEWLIPFFVVMLFWKLKQSTPGKMIFGFKIVDAKTLGKVPIGRLILRYLAYFLSMLPLFAGCIWVAFDAKKQAWHDKIAGTVIVKSKSV